jgi:glycosyltransferase involved in cell wall biosynthesis/SAM-dependent methyltransferase
MADEAAALAGPGVGRDVQQAERRRRRGETDVRELLLPAVGTVVSHADGAEARVGRALEEAGDLSAGSDSLSRHVTDAATEYHLSPRRADLLRPFRWRPGLRVLDCGVGTGALARYVGEQGVTLVGLESSPQRAALAARRCAGVGGVRVLIGDVVDYEDDAGFDIVLCIGVYEHALGRGSESGRAFLAALRRLTRPSGLLLLAIENQIGLKYLAGHPEDHIGSAWAGPEGDPGAPHARTLTRRRLADEVRAAGFPCQRFMYPFPDYKLPRVILDESAYARPSAAGDLDQLIRWPNDGARSPQYRFDERRAHRVLIDAGLGPEVANSFLVLAGSADADVRRLLPGRTWAWHFASDRSRCWRALKRFRVRADGRDKAVVFKPLHSGSSRGWLSQAQGSVRPFASGASLEQLALDAIAERGDLQHVLRLWVGATATREFADAEASAARPRHPFSPAADGAALPSDYLDLALSNFILTPDSEVVYIDREWIADGPVDATLVRARALWWFAVDIVHRGVTHPWGADATVDDVAESLGLLAGVRADHRALHALRDAEADLLAKVRDGRADEQRRALDRTARESQTSISELRRLPWSTVQRRIAGAADAVATVRREREQRLAQLSEEREASLAASSRSAAAHAEAEQRPGIAESIARATRDALPMEEAARRAAEARVDDMARQLDCAREETGRPAETLAALSARLTASQAEITALEETLRLLGRDGQTEPQTTAPSPCDEKGAALQREVEALRDHVADLRRVSDLRQADVTDAVASARHDQARLAHVMAEHAALLLELDARNRSRVWRWTAWPRGIARRARLVRLLLAHDSPAGWLRARRVLARARHITECGLFDPEYYRSQAAIAHGPLGCALHYVLVGREAGFAPHPLFDGRYYQSRRGTIDADVTPLEHYVQARPRISPHPLFDSDYYLARYPDVAAAGVDPMLHYLAYGAAEGRDPHALFATAYYLEQYPDVRGAGLNPLVHYCRYGGREGRRPCQLFDGAFYLAANPDVAESGMNPLEHFVLFGDREGRDPGPTFSTRLYRLQYPDVARSGVNALRHYVEYGLHEGRQAPPPQAVARVTGSARAHIDEPTGPRRVERGEPFVVRGWVSSEAPARVAAWVLRTRGQDHPLSVPGPPYQAGEPIRFEEWLTLDAAGPAVITLEARLGDGGVEVIAALPQVEVEDRVFHDPMEHHLPSPRVFSVLFLDGLGRAFASPRYRIDHVREALALVGVTSGLTDETELSERIDLLRGYDVLVLFRAAWSNRLDAVVGQARRWNIPVVFDVDDYIFEPEIATPDWIAGIRDWSDGDIVQYRDGVRRYRETLTACDAFTAPTGYLVDRAAELGKTAYVITNSLGQELLAISRRTALTAGHVDGTVEVVYQSGTSTHQRDFATIVAPLVALMKARPCVRLKVIGHLDLEEYADLGALDDRVTKEPFVPWRELPARTAGAAIAIAPLEIGNPFCEAKSELKYFEAAACGLAFVGPATRTFREAVIEGETGFCCTTPEEWYSRLLWLVDNPADRAAMGDAACRHVMNRYGPAYLARQACQAYEDVIRQSRTRRAVPPSALSVRWVVPEVTAGSGGHNDIFLGANEMARRGHAVTMHVVGSSCRSAAGLKEFIETRFGYEVLFAVELGMGDLRPCDALIATHHATVKHVERAMNLTLVPAYFVQDFEPFFAPIGADYFAAERTYRSGLLCITLGPWLEQLLTTRYGARARHVSFFVDRAHYYPGPARTTAGRQRVAFFGRPHMPRRCYELGVDALRLLHRMRPDVEICIFGADDFPGLDGLPHVDMGTLSRDRLGDLYRSADVGLAFSTTNPSLATFEMMACGLPLVDLDVFDSRERHGGYPAVLTEATGDALARAMARVLDDGALAASLRAESLAFTSSLPDPSTALGRISEIVEDEIHGDE